MKAAFGMHVWPTLPSGSVRSRAGTIMAGTIQFDVTVRGRGGHAAMPHLTKDAVLAGAAITTAIQALVSRETSPFDSAVISVTRFSAGDAYNVLPDTGEGGRVAGWLGRAGWLAGLRQQPEQMWHADLAVCFPHSRACMQLVPSPPAW